MNANPTPDQIFMKLIYTMEQDNGSEFVFFYPDSQKQRAISAIQLMQASGLVFPDPQSPEADSLNGVYWQLSAGEESEVYDQYCDTPGFKDLNQILGEIFMGTEEEK